MDQTIAFRHLQPQPILQERLPDDVVALAARRLPGIAPLAMSDWLCRDEVFAAQMALRDRLLATCRDRVLSEASVGSEAGRELLELVAVLCASNGYRREAGGLIRPDGVHVPLAEDTPLATAARLVQEDLLILEPGPDGHVLTEGALMFPASWTLAEKIGRALPGIHRPVPSYDDALVPRVQRLFDAIRPEQPLVRANVLAHDDFRLFQPHSEADPRRCGPDPGFLRSERQALLRLPQTGAVVFSIHTYVVRKPPAQDL